MSYFPEKISSSIFSCLNNSCHLSTSSSMIHNILGAMEHLEGNLRAPLQKSTNIFVVSKPRHPPKVRLIFSISLTSGEPNFLNTGGPDLFYAFLGLIGRICTLAQIVVLLPWTDGGNFLQIKKIFRTRPHSDLFWSLSSLAKANV